LGVIFVHFLVSLEIYKKKRYIMNKLQLTDAVAAKAQITKKEAAAAVSAVLDVIAETLAAGGDVKITGFGGFEVKERAARTGRNPKTGEAVEIPASKYVAFSTGSTLKDKVNG
jgi:DNA-binding protein HU-beta